MASKENINTNLDPNLKLMMSYSYEENINYLLKNNYLNNSEVDIIDKLNNDLLNGKELDVALSDFERNIGTLTLSEKKNKFFLTSLIL